MKSRARKRLDILLQVFNAVRRQLPNARLLRVGGRFTPAQQQLARDLGVENAIVEAPPLSRDVLAAAYRRADLLLLGHQCVLQLLKTPLSQFFVGRPVRVVECATRGPNGVFHIGGVGIGLTTVPARLSWVVAIAAASGAYPEM